MSAGAPHGFSAVVAADGGVIVVGEVDIATAAFLEEAIERAARAHDGDVVVDLSAVGFLDSSGMNVFVRCHKPLRTTGRALVLRKPSPAVRRALEAGGIATFLRID